jgi:serine phosphatase RsbU (regulator of sigma subunit)
MENHEDILKQGLFPSSGNPPGPKLTPIETIEKETLTSLCSRIREKLQTDHVICPEVRAAEFCQAIRDPDSPVRAILEDGFYKLLTIEVSNGLDSKGEFDHDGRFLPYLRQALYAAFGIEPTAEFHPEQIGQVVKDEPRSLFCFLDAQHIQGPDAQRLRIFTQGRHRVVICALPSRPGLDRSRSAVTNLPSNTVQTATAPPRAYVPTLEVISGPLAGRSFNLERELTLIGRSPDCDIVLQPKSVSRKHCAVVRRSGGFELKDVGSTRGTFVDSRRLTQPVVLESGNVIQIGEVILSFSSAAVRIDDLEALEMDTVHPAIDMLEMSSDRHVVLVKPETKLQALRLIGEELGSTRALSEVLERIFNSLFEIFPRAERGFVLLKDPITGNLVPESVRSRIGEVGELRVSKTIVNRVLNTGHAILSKDVLKEFPESDSASGSSIRSLICAPLMDQARKPMGIIQIDTKDGKGRFDQDDLDLLAAVASQISVAVQLAQLNKALVNQREMDQELRFARQVVQSLLPDRPPALPGYEFWAYYEPARHVGGDYYTFIPVGERSLAPDATPRRWAIAVGEAVGKGMPAALLAAKLAGEVKLLLSSDADPVRVVEQLNRQFQEGGGAGLDLYITFLLVILDVERHHLSVVNAGHPCPMIRRRDGRIEEFGKGTSGLPLAIMSDYNYEISETGLEPGETVILYTDGVSDAHSAAGDRFGESGLRRWLQSAPNGAVAAGESIVKAIAGHVADQPQFDDITLVCLARR